MSIWPISAKRLKRVSIPAVRRAGDILWVGEKCALKFPSPLVLFRYRGTTGNLPDCPWR